MTQKIRVNELNRIIEKLIKIYPQLLQNIYFKPGNDEQICGSISDEINKYLRSGLGVESREFSGFYYGMGTENSGRAEGTGHCWVEFDYLDEIHKEHTVIIDGAYAQFLPYSAPTSLKDKVRLTIFIDEPSARDWYKGNPMNAFYTLNQNGLRGIIR